MESASSIIGISRAARAIREFASLAADVDATVLITGETGTGKGALAAAIHGGSARRGRPLVAVNCAGVPESLFESEFFGHARGAFTGAHASRRGMFEQAHRGTLFLDEIGELSPALQAKLLTTLEDGVVRRVGGESATVVDARVIAATSVDLEAATNTGAFRLDLLHRLLVLTFHMPPLRERDGDILLLARHFLTMFAARYGRTVGDFTPEAERCIRAHPWPGNIRQLAHAMEATVLHSRRPLVTPSDLPRRLLGAATVPEAPPARYSFYGDSEGERARILAALRSNQGNLTRTARSLGMARNTLRRRADLLGVPLRPA